MKPCILLIEDDSDMRELVAGHLEHGGFDVQRADDGIKGQALALQYTPDLILLDLMLPKVDGLTLCQRRTRAPLRQQGADVLHKVGAQEAHERGMTQPPMAAHRYRKLLGLEQLDHAVAAHTELRHRHKKVVR